MKTARAKTAPAKAIVTSKITKASKSPARKNTKKVPDVSGGLKVGDKAPAFAMPSLQGTVTLAGLKGKNVVLYFYPKDDTSGCTKEACGFQEAMPKFKKMNAVVLGVSKDSLASHEKFAKKYKLGFNLASDEDVKVATAYGVWVEKSMYGRSYMGMERATFVIDEKGKIAAIWRNVKVPGHVEEVAAAL